MEIKATDKNLSHIKGLINKLSKGKVLNERLFYPTSKKRSHVRKSLLIPKRSILKSNLTTFLHTVIEVDFMFGKHFIRVHNNMYANDYYGNNPYLAFIINCGDLVEIKNNVVYIRTSHPTNRNEKANQVIYFTCQQH